MLCPSCASQIPVDARFCSSCGYAITTARTEERRITTVLFADLVGFTTLSEGRDPEEVRELLSRYFDAAREQIDRYVEAERQIEGEMARRQIRA